MAATRTTATTPDRPGSTLHSDLAGLLAREAFQAATPPHRVVGASSFATDRQPVLGSPSERPPANGFAPAPSPPLPGVPPRLTAHPGRWPPRTITGSRRAKRSPLVPRTASAHQKCAQKTARPRAFPAKGNASGTPMKILQAARSPVNTGPPADPPDTGRGQSRDAWQNWHTPCISRDNRFRGPWYRQAGDPSFMQDPSLPRRRVEPSSAGER